MRVKFSFQKNASYILDVYLGTTVSEAALELYHTMGAIRFSPCTYVDIQLHCFSDGTEHILSMTIIKHVTTNYDVIEFVKSNIPLSFDREWRVTKWDESDKTYHTCDLVNPEKNIVALVDVDKAEEITYFNKFYQDKARLIRFDDPIITKYGTPDGNDQISFGVEEALTKVRFVFNGKHLDNGRTLGEYNIRLNDTVGVFLRLCGS